MATYKILVEISELKTPLGRSRCRCNDNNKTYHKETGYGIVGCFNLAQGNIISVEKIL
jgi:hypothetical protein